MSALPPALSSHYERTRLRMLLEGSGPNRDGLLAHAFKTAVEAVADFVPPILTYPIWKPAAEVLNETSLSAYLAESEFGKWSLLGAVCKPDYCDERFMWPVLVGEQGSSCRRMVCVLDIGYVRQDGGYDDRWFPTGQIRSNLNLGNDRRSGPDEDVMAHFSLALVEQLALRRAQVELERRD